MHILVVEDEERLARLVARVLTEERHVVDVANDGDNGLYLALRGTYDLIILDLMLPAATTAWISAARCARNASHRRS